MSPNKAGKRLSVSAHQTSRRYELFTCGMRGHAFVGTDAEVIRPCDSWAAREESAIRSFRCLRCDGWYPFLPPVTPGTRTIPDLADGQSPNAGFLSVNTTFCG